MHELNEEAHLVRERGSRDEKPELQLRNDDRSVEDRVPGLHHAGAMRVGVLHDGADKLRIDAPTSIVWQHTGVGHVEAVRAPKPAEGPANKLLV